MNKLSIQDLTLENEKVLMRVDFNVPLQEEGKITDETRIISALPSIEYVLKQGASLVLMSHLGRPKGKKEPKLSLKPIAQRLSQLLDTEVVLLDPLDSQTKTRIKEMKPGSVVLLENLRFYEGEEHPEKDPSFTETLASFGTLFINEAFGTSHRKHASVYEIPKLFEGKAAAGFLMEKEIAYLSQLTHQPKRPFHVLIGGAKVSGKVGLIQNFVEKIDALLIGGAMAFTFLKAKDFKTGDSLVEQDQVEVAKDIIHTCESKAVQLYLPTDLVIASRFENEAETKIVSVKDGVPQGWQGLDIGPKTVQEFKEAMNQAKTVFWNGPMGVFEMPNFAKGTSEIAEMLSTLDATTIIGGGDSVSAINNLKLESKFTHLSTGGGASMEYLEHGELPGINILTNR